MDQPSGIHISKKDISMLEKIQRKAARFIKQDYHSQQGHWLNTQCFSGQCETNMYNFNNSAIFILNRKKEKHKYGCNSRGILVILVMLQVWLEKNWKQWSVCFGCIFDMGLHWLKWEKKWASLKKISTLIFGKMFDFFVPRRSWQFPVKSDAKASISFARPWNSP